jgi:hypothetical protein
MKMMHPKAQARPFGSRTLAAPILAGFAFLALFAAHPAQADIRADVTRYATIAADGERLACFDLAAQEMRVERDAAAVAATQALATEFRFDRNMLSGPLSLKVEVSGNLRLSRDTFAAREIEGAVRRITKALGDIEGWKLEITVHGGKVALSRGSPYSGEELLLQAESGMKRSGLPDGRYTIQRGSDADPLLWDDGRVRSANEHIDIVITGLGNTGSR